MSNTRSGGGTTTSLGEKRPGNEEGYLSGNDKSDKGILKRFKTTQIDYTQDAFSQLPSRLKKNGVATNYEKQL